MLEIKRISGATLSMAQFYINLAIVDLKRNTDKNQQSVLPNELVYDNRNDNSKVEMNNLFNPRKRIDGNTRKPRRILVRGRAGVGKTTLCKKVVHELTRSPRHTNFPSWVARYDRVLWLPLRNLKLHSLHIGYTLYDLIRDEYFARVDDASILAQALSEQCTKGDVNGPGRTLYLLDGLDEVSHLLDAEHKASGFLHWLLERPDVIITSRPGSAIHSRLSRLDCEFETVGFTVNQIRTYLDRTMHLELARKLSRFLYSRPLLLNLARIPVQLDALSYVWNVCNQTLRSKSTSNKMAFLHRPEGRVLFLLWAAQLQRAKMEAGWAGLPSSFDARQKCTFNRPSRETPRSLF